MTGETAAGWRRRGGLAASAALLAASTLLGGGPVAANAETTIQMRDHFYSPRVDAVEAGQTVTWLNRGQRVHSITAEKGLFASGRLNPGETWAWTPAEAGTYAYYCTVHLAMRGTVVVYAPGATPPDTGQSGDETESTAEVTVAWPSDGATVAGVLNVNGYAIEEAAADGTGFDRVQVYLDGDRNTGQLLGEATYGEDRPDIANSLGRQQFLPSGFDFTWDPAGLTGKHTFFIYAHQTATGEWIGTSVTVTLL